MGALSRIEPHDASMAQVVDMAEAQALAATIDVTSPLTVAGFGQEIGKTARDYSDSLLSQARSGDLDEMGGKLGEVVVAARSFDIDSFDNKWARLPLLGPVIAGVSRTKARAVAQFTSLEGQVEKLMADVESAERRLSDRAATLDVLYSGTEQEYHNLALHEAAAKIRLETLGSEIAAMIGNDPVVAERRAALEASRVALDKRAADLEILRHSALQTLPMIRMIQANNMVLIEKFQTIRNLTVPAWKRAFMMALALNEQRDAAKLANDIDDATNYFMVRNSELLHQNAVSTAKANQRLVIDVETLRTVHQNIVKTLTDVRQANQDGAVMRQKALAELTVLRQEMLGASAAAPVQPSLPRA